MQPFYHRNRLEKIKIRPTWYAWFEMLLITGIALVWSALSRPHDPFFINAAFPWPLFGPALVGLRYGFFFGFISVLMVLGSVALSIKLHWWAAASFPYNYAIGLTAVVMLVGEFRDVWGRRIERLQESNDYRQVRLNEFTRNYHLLKVSHDRLEQQVAGSGHSLREGLRFIHKKMSDYSFQGLNTDIAQSLLNIMAEYGNLQRAVIFVSKHQDEPVMVSSLYEDPFAVLGVNVAVSHQDPLIERCLQSRRLVSVRPEFADSEFADSKLLACIPLFDAEEHLWAVVAVEMMPFFSFQEKTLRLLAVLAGHMADMLNTHSQIQSVADEEIASLTLNLRRALHDQIQFGIPSALLVFDIDQGETGQGFIDMVIRLQRGLDIIIKQKRKTAAQLVILLPLTDELGVAGYRQRLEDFLKSEMGSSFSDASVTLYRHFLVNQEALDQFIQQRIWDGQKMAYHSSDPV